jgi:hypothetical protein
MTVARRRVGGDEIGREENQNWGHKTREAPEPPGENHLTHWLRIAASQKTVNGTPAGFLRTQKLWNGTSHSNRFDRQGRATNEVGNRTRLLYSVSQMASRHQLSTIPKRILGATDE